MAELNINTHAVLKLQLDDNAGTRRIAFARLWDGPKSTVSYEKLVYLAIEYSFPDDAKFSLDCYDVAITYLDEDGDTITVSTDDELVEAFLQFVEKQPPVLRARASVKRNKNAPSPPLATALNFVLPAPVSAPAVPVPVPIPVPASLPAPVDSTDTPIPTEASTSRGQEQKEEANQPGQATKQLQAILESFVSVLASAMIALQNHVATPPESQSMSRTGCPIVVPTSTIATATPRAAEKARAHSRSPSPVASKKEKKEDENKLENEHPKTEREVEIKVEKTADVETNECDGETKNHNVLGDIDSNFIHGRHTCDGCLKTPIIGTRFHATNLPDYDLCQSCIGNYRGKDINFEPAELDRDRPLQLRWKRRQERRARQAEVGVKPYPGGRCLGVRPQPPCRKVVHRNEVPMDFALKEAIRRSLLDANSARVPKNDEQEKNEELNDGTKNVNIEEALTKKSLVDAPQCDDSDEVEEPKEHEKVEELITKNVQQEESKKPKDSNIIFELEDEKLKGPTETPEEKIEVADFHQSVLVGGEVTDYQDVEEIKSEADAISLVEVESVNSEDFDDEDLEVEEDTTPEEEEDTTPAQPESSFSTEAEGSIAEAIGSTLDHCADAIDAIVSEFALSEFSDTKKEEAIVKEDMKGVASGVVKGPSRNADSVSALTSSFPSVDVQNIDDTKLVENEPELIADPSAAEMELPDEELMAAVVSAESEGVTIVDDGDKKDETKSVSGNVSEDGWSVVDEDAQKDAQVANDTMLARAAELIGSALFESDMSASAINIPTEEKSSDISSVASVPTSVSTVSTRWENELKQLHSMGFQNDIYLTEILEGLEVAKFIKGATGSITVGDAVNYLLAHPDE